MASHTSTSFLPVQALYLIPEILAHLHQVLALSSNIHLVQLQKPQFVAGHGSTHL